MWVLSRSDVSSAWVMQQSQQWSLRQTWARCAEFGVPATPQRRPARKPAESEAATPVGLCLAANSVVACRRLPAPTAARIVTQRAGGLASLGAWALGERGGALGERWAGAVCGARRATWCVRGVLRTVWCVGSADVKRVRSGGGRTGRPLRCRSVGRGAAWLARRGRSGRRRCRRRLWLAN